MQRYKKSAKSKTEQVKNLHHLRNLRDQKTIRVRKRKIRVKTKKSLRNLSKSEALIKEGGYLLSRIALQYHRRK